MASRIPYRLAWLGITLSATFLCYITAFYFSFRSDWNFLLEKQDVVFNAFWRTAFYIHITGGMLAIMLGPFQFLPWLRNHYRRLHRSVGKVYLGAILFVAAPSGLFMAFYAEGGILGMIGFSIMALLWMLTTWMAYETIRKRDIIGHRAWMTRSFALTMAAVTLRIWVPFASEYLNIDEETVETTSAWISWIPNLIIAELLLKFSAKNL